MGVVLSSAFYARPTLDVARDLLGKVLVHRARAGTVAGSIVEVEAYIGESDPACHAVTGLTRRNAPLYGPPGRAYVYLIYGIHRLVNAVTEPEGFPAAVLIRALEPRDGIALMRRRRSRGMSGRASPLHDTDLCCGPGNLTRACGINLSQNRLDLSGGQLFIEDSDETISRVVWSPRIGIRVGIGRRWRCFAWKNPSVSGDSGLGVTTDDAPGTPLPGTRARVRSE